MEFQLIRCATLRVDYAQHRFIIDPYLADKHSMPSCAGISPNPMVPLPCSPQEAIAGIDMAIVSHLHSDHFDSTAVRLLSKDLPLMCQPDDDIELENMGFLDVIPVFESISWNGINITRIAGQHGTGEVLTDMGKVSGFVFEAENEPTIYWAGDTIWHEAVAEAIDHFQPDMIITHSCGAMWGNNVLIVMDAEQTVAVCHAAPNSIVIATHMESEDHSTVSRQALRAYAQANGVRFEQLLIPMDGEKLSF